MLAFAHDDGGPFTMVNTLQNNENVPLGSLYLIWDNLHSKALLESGASDMPYQIKTIALSLEAPYPQYFATLRIIGAGSARICAFSQILYILPYHQRRSRG